MNRDVYRYSFDDSIPMEDVESSLLLAILGVESLHGESQAHLDARYLLDAELRVCVIDGSTQAGADLNRLFNGYLRREFGADQFQVKRMDAAAAGELAGAAA